MSGSLVYIPPSLATKLNYPLSQISLIGLCPVLCPKESQPRARTNHWLLHLVTMENIIQLDFSPTGASNGSATLIVSNITDFDIDEVAKSCAFRVQEGTTAKDIIDRITNAGMIRYLFSAEGQGCRYWVSQVLRLLHKEEVLLETLDGGAGPHKCKVESGIDVLTKVWHQKEMVESEEQSGIVEGIFY